MAISYRKRIQVINEDGYSIPHSDQVNTELSSLILHSAIRVTHSKASADTIKSVVLIMQGFKAFTINFDDLAEKRLTRKRTLTDKPMLFPLTYNPTVENAVANSIYMCIYLQLSVYYPPHEQFQGDAIFGNKM